MNMMVWSISLKTIGLGVNMEDYFTEMRLSRAFACEFDKFLNENPKLVPTELRETYLKLKQHYEFEMSKELS